MLFCKLLKLLFKKKEIQSKTNISVDCINIIVSLKKGKIFKFSVKITLKSIKIKDIKDIMCHLGANMPDILFPIL